jgi:hypothetical protein
MICIQIYIERKPVVVAAAAVALTSSLAESFHGHRRRQSHQAEMSSLGKT